MSPRPKRNRRIESPPKPKGYKPVGVPASDIGKETILFEEYESLRLVDYLNLSQEEAAKIMQVSRPTFTRIYDNVRKKLAKAFVEGASIIFQGGNVLLEDEWYRCNDCNETFKATDLEACDVCDSSNIEHINNTILDWQAKKVTAGGNFEKICICEACGYTIKGQKGVPCRNVICEKCGKKMIRK